MKLPAPQSLGLTAVHGRAGQKARRSAVQAGGASRPEYGLSMRFDVTVAAGAGLAQPLGQWSGCSGLGLQLKVDEYLPGGRYESNERFPDRVTYGQVTLERAMDAASSDALQKWLKHVIANWVSSDEVGAEANPGTTVTITMLSNGIEWKPIYQWTLHNAVPVSWSGPSLSAKGGDVAIEKLTLAYTGLDGSKPGANPAGAAAQAKSGKGAGAKPTGNDGKLKLGLLESSDVNAKVKAGEEIEFRYNPQKVTVEKSVKSDSKKIVGTNREDQITDLGRLIVKLSDLRVEGVADVQRTVSKLFRWLDVSADIEASGSSAGSAAKPMLSYIKVTMGGAAAGKATTGADDALINYRQTLRSVNVTYTRFTPAGVPNRAVVSLTMQEADTPKGGTNPTSGSRESGRAHTVTAGDSLPSIAKDAYGRPSEWRKIADENGIDDPLRVRNGRSLLLPGVA